MKRSERNEIIKWAAGASDKEIEKKYYDIVFDSLGNNAEEMYERCCAMEDILEKKDGKD